MTTLDFSRPHRRRARSAPSPSRCKQDAAAATTRAASPSGSAAAATSGATASSTSGATSATSRPRWRRIEYDPNRSARIALLHYADGEKRYILAPDGLKVGQTVVAGEAADILPGNALPLELDPRRHHDPQPRAAPRQGRAARAQRRRRRPAGGEGRRLRPGQAALGRGAPGRTSTAWPPSARSATSTTRTSRSARPGASAGWAAARTTAASSMNPIDHPHGGGEGRTSGGRHPVTPVGQAHQGRQDAQQQADRQRFIVKRRK